MLRANPFGLCQRFGLLLPQGGSLLVQDEYIYISLMQEWVQQLWTSGDRTKEPAIGVGARLDHKWELNFLSQSKISVGG